MSDNTVSIWKIAGGILLALVIWRTFETWQYNRDMKKVNAQIEATFRPLVDAEKQSRNAQQQRSWEAANRLRTMEEAKRLKDGERCIGKQRFRRLANGWEQIGSC